MPVALGIIEITKSLMMNGFTPQQKPTDASTPVLCTHIRCQSDVMVTPTHVRVRPQIYCVNCKPNAKLDADVAAQAAKEAGFTPLEDFVNTYHDWLVRHDVCGKTSRMRYFNMLRSTKCSYCAGKKRLGEEKAIAEYRAHGVEPSVPYPGADAPWEGVHECGTRVAPRLSSLRRGQGACPACGAAAAAAARVQSGAEKAVQDYIAAGCTPTTDFPGTKVPWEGIHNACGNTITPRLNMIRKGQRPCKHCARRCAKDCTCSVRTGRAA